MGCVSILILATLFSVTVSQLEITANKYSVKEHESVIFTCKVPDFTDNVFVVQDSNSRAVCYANSACSSTNDSLYTATKSGTTVIFEILSFSKERDEGSWIVRYGTNSDSNPVEITAFISSPTSQMNTYLASERTKSGNSIFEFSNMTLLITGSTTPTSDISASTTSYLNTDSTFFSTHTEVTKFYSNTETAHFYTSSEAGTSYANTETSKLNANIETTILYENNKTANDEIQSKTLGIISHSLSNSYSMFVTTSVNDISGSFDSTSQIITETLPPPGYSISPHNEITIPSTFGTSNVFHETLKETSIPFSMVTLSDIVFNTLHVSSDSLFKTDASEYAIVSMTISPSYVGDSYISLITETGQNPTITTIVTVDSIENSAKSESLLLSVSLNNSRLQHMITGGKSPWMPLTSIIDQISFSSDIVSPSFSSFQHFTDTIETLTNNSVNHELPLSQEYTTAVSTSSGTFSQSIDHYLSSQTTEHQITVQTKFISFHSESNTDSSTSEIFSTEILTTEKSYVHTNEQLQTTFFEHYSQSTDLFFSSEKPDNFLSAFQSTSSLFPINTKTNGTGIDSYMKTTNMRTIETQSCLLKTDPSLFTNISSIQNFSELSEFKTTLLATRIHSDNLSIPSMITPSFQQTNSDNVYFKIDTSFEDSLFSAGFYYESLTSNEQIITKLSSIVFKSVSKLSTSTVHSRLSEKTKTTIFISTTSGLLAILVITLIIVFARMYMSKGDIKPHKGKISLGSSDNSRSHTTAFPDYIFTTTHAYPILNTASYENNWNNVV